MTLAVRELPPLRHTTELTTPKGKRYRWASDEPDASNVPSGVSSSSTMPGGFEQYQASLPRRPGVDYADLEPLSTITERAADGEIIGEFRLERTPRVSGQQMVINPAAVGWQAHLADDQDAHLIIITRAINWTGPSRTRQLTLLGASYQPRGGPSTSPDRATGAPSLDVGWEGSWNGAAPIAEAVYDAGPGNRIGELRLSWQKTATVNHADPLWQWWINLASDDTTASPDSVSLSGLAGPGASSVTATQDRQCAMVQLFYNSTSAAGTDGAVYQIAFTDVRLIGDHDLTSHGDTPGTEGFLASDVIAHVISRFAPLLKFTTGPLGTIQPSSYPIPQLTWPDSTNAGEMVRGATRFGLEDWAVWESRTFHWHGRGARGRRWLARVAQAGLEETGPQIDQLWESVVVEYRDVDGSTRRVGPPGSGADVESSSLKDADPENPANQLGIPRRTLLRAGTLTPEAAIEIGRRFLAEQKALDSSGRARFVGYVMDERGVMHPTSHVRAGDQVRFIDAADGSWRRIVRADHQRKERAVTVDLDAPPDGLAAVLERLQAEMVGLGV